MELSLIQSCLYLILLLDLAFFAQTSEGSPKVIDAGGKGISRDAHNGIAFAHFKAHKFSYLNITSLGADFVLNSRECGIACVNIPPCFSFNLAAFYDINRRILCELLSSDQYNNSDKFIGSPLFHHFSIPSPCSSWPCQNNGTCVSRYENNSYVCVCPKKCRGKYCQYINECESSPCLNNGTCTDLVNGFNCSCPLAFSGDLCEKVIIRCEKDTCLNNGTCTDGGNGFNCSCPHGFNGDRCGTGLEKSNILSDHGGSVYIQDLSKFLYPVFQTSSSKWERCWRAQKDGWTASTFHGNCDNKGPTVTIVRVDNYIFGGYTSMNWSSPDSGKWKYLYDSKAFLFSLYTTIAYNLTKFKIKHHLAQGAIHACSTKGPTFGGGHDLVITDGGRNSYTYVSSYHAPPGCSSSSYCSFFAGQNKFNASDVEVFYEK